jgi:hypothetical protein
MLHAAEVVTSHRGVIRQSPTSRLPDKTPTELRMPPTRVQAWIVWRSKMRLDGVTCTFTRCAGSTSALAAAGPVHHAAASYARVDLADDPTACTS